MYGSRANGTHKHGSDIDLTLCGTDLTLNVLSRIMDDLLLPYTMDVSILQDIRDLAVIDHIQRVGVPLYETAPGGR